MSRNILQKKRKLNAVSMSGILLAVSLVNLNCGKDNAVTDPGSEAALSLHYDAGQLSSPTLAAGAYEAAARFTSVQIGDWAGRTITEVQYYIANPPENCRVKIYGANDSNSPGTELYAAEVTSTTSANQWNVHKLTQGVKLTSTDIWISIAFSHSTARATIGCDPGPAVKDGDWLYATSDNAWQPLSNRTPISINWNIRGIVE